MGRKRFINEKRLSWFNQRFTTLLLRLGILNEFAVNAKTDGQAWNELEVHKHVCSIGNTHIFVCFYDLSVGDNSPRVMSYHQNFQKLQPKFYKLSTNFSMML